MNVLSESICINGTCVFGVITVITELTLGFENQTISVVESVGSFKICAAITGAINTDSQIEILLYAYPSPGTAGSVSLWAMCLLQFCTLLKWMAE